MNLAVKSNESDLKIKELNEKIELLSRENENLKNNSSIDNNPSTANDNNNNNNILTTTTTSKNNGKEFGDKLRLEELTKRWKLAEEKLLFERTESNKKLKELENEILILKKK
ncbi:hypothetical protein B5S30_g4425 [[Candida] boidinii]|nr:hypothetical protein B5S30_g4425 [[Candida] boidinii]GMG39345.1 unnamed protein product [[Candida] boidinii]